MVNKRKAKPNGTVSRVVHVDVRELVPSPENAILYRERTLDDSDFLRLTQSILREGVQAPLLVSKDGWIVSGHQRQKGAIEAERYLVPVIYLTIKRQDYTSDEWLAVLREHNAGREKKFDELVREKLIDIDPDDAIAHIVDDRIKRSRSRVATIDIGSKEMKRCGISEAKRSMADAVLSVIQMLDAYLPVSLRAIHYRLLSQVVWRNSISKLRYQNDRNSYQDLSDLLTRMRLSGEVDWGAISDETRPVTRWSCWKSGADFISEKAVSFLKGYSRDLLQSQPMHFEIVVEKLTVQNFIESVAMRYRMPMVVMRGNSSIDARHQIYERFRASGKNKLFLFCLGDCDADGDSIVDSTLRSMRDDFHLRDVDGTRVAMTHAQADGLNLPKMLDAKTTSPNYGKFVAKHKRSDCYELDAVDPDVMQGWTDAAIRSVIDIEAFNHEVEQQKAEAKEILARRQTVLRIMNEE